MMMEQTAASGVTVSMTIGQWIVMIARTLLTLQDSATGQMPAGHNGPYRDAETPVRNTANALRVFVLAWRISGDCVFREAAYVCADYLTGDNAPRQNWIWIHRKAQGKDSVYGLIGPAWVLGALRDAGRWLDHKVARIWGQRLIEWHSFDPARGWWRVADPSVQDVDAVVDPTLNHQLWFTAEVAAFSAGMNACSHEITTIRDRAKNVLDHLACNLALDADGCIRQAMRTGWRMTLRRAVKSCLHLRKRGRERERAAAYHAFNLHALARLRQAFPEHGFWQSDKFHAVCGFMDTKRFVSAAMRSDYGMGYNPVGFELAVFYGLPVQDGAGRQYAISRIRAAFNAQLLQTWNPVERLLSRNTDDVVTLSCRVSELADTPDWIWTISVEVPDS